MAIKKKKRRLYKNSFVVDISFDNKHFYKTVTFPLKYSTGDLFERCTELFISGRIRNLPFVRTIDHFYLCTNKRGQLSFQFQTKKVEVKPHPLQESTKEIISFGKEIAGKLSEFEKLGVVYGDLKFENLLYNGKEYIFVDFGSSVLPGMLLNSATLLLASPESVRRDPVFSTHDTYSLASLLVHKLTGCYPNEFFRTNKILMSGDPRMYNQICRMIDSVVRDTRLADILKQSLHINSFLRPTPTQLHRQLALLRDY